VTRLVAIALLALTACATIPDKGPPAWLRPMDNGAHVMLVWRGAYCLAYYCQAERDGKPCALMEIGTDDETCKPAWAEKPE
jgi:hypothetical protein